MLVLPHLFPVDKTTFVTIHHPKRFPDIVKTTISLGLEDRRQTGNDIIIISEAIFACCIAVIVLVTQSAAIDGCGSGAEVTVDLFF